MCEGKCLKGAPICKGCVASNCSTECQRAGARTRCASASRACLGSEGLGEVGVCCLSVTRAASLGLAACPHTRDLRTRCSAPPALPLVTPNLHPQPFHPDSCATTGTRLSGALWLCPSPALALIHALPDNQRSYSQRQPTPAGQVLGSPRALSIGNLASLLRAFHCESRIFARSPHTPSSRTRGKERLLPACNFLEFCKNAAWKRSLARFRHRASQDLGRQAAPGQQFRPPATPGLSRRACTTATAEKQGGLRAPVRAAANARHSPSPAVAPRAPFRSTAARGLPRTPQLKGCARAANRERVPWRGSQARIYQLGAHRKW